MVTVTKASGQTSAEGYIEKLIRYKEGVDAATAKARRIAMETDKTIESYLRGSAAGDFFLAILKYGAVPTFPAIEDGKVMPLGGWIPAIQSGNYNKMPIILGSNEYEMKPFMPLYYSFVIPYKVPSTYKTDGTGYSWFSLFTSVRNNNTPALASILPLDFDVNLYEKSGYFGTRYWKAKFVDSVAHELSKVQDKVYAYLFKWGGIGSGPYPFDFIYGAGHSGEIPFFFGGDKGLFDIPDLTAPGTRALQDGMMGYLSNFARTGNPNSGDPNKMFPKNRTKWLQWSNAYLDPKAIVFDADYNQAKITMTNEEVTFTGVDAERADWISKQSNDIWVGALTQKDVAGIVTGMFQFHFPW
jgi:para-nitrobenzyl esterase